MTSGFTGAAERRPLFYSGYSSKQVFDYRAKKIIFIIADKATKIKIVFTVCR
jgi:hypothetical protein